MKWKIRKKTKFSHVELWELTRFVRRSGWFCFRKLNEKKAIALLG